MVGFCLLVAVSFVTVTSSALSANIPLTFGPFTQCSYDAFHNEIIPKEDSCRYSYYFCLMLFGLIVVPLSVMNLKEQAVIQAIFGLLRIVMIAMIVVYCIVKLIEGGDICQDQRINPEQFNATESCHFEGSAGNFTAGTVIDMYDIITRFDPRGWLVAIPLLTYPFLLHHSIPSFTHPIGKKKYLWPFILCTYIFLECVSFVWVLLSPCGLRLKLKNQLS